MDTRITQPVPATVTSPLLLSVRRATRRRPGRPTTPHILVAPAFFCPFDEYAFPLSPRCTLCACTSHLIESDERVFVFFSKKVAKSVVTIPCKMITHPFFEKGPIYRNRVNITGYRFFSLCTVLEFDKHYKNQFFPWGAFVEFGNYYRNQFYFSERQFEKIPPLFEHSRGHVQESHQWCGHICA